MRAERLAAVRGADRRRVNFCVLCGTSDGWGFWRYPSPFLLLEGADGQVWRTHAATRQGKDGDAAASSINKTRRSSGKNTAVARESDEDDDDDHINRTSRSPKHRMEGKMRKTSKHRYTHSPGAVWLEGRGSSCCSGACARATNRRTRIRLYSQRPVPCSNCRSLRSHLPFFFFRPSSICRHARTTADPAPHLCLAIPLLPPDWLHRGLRQTTRSELDQPSTFCCSIILPLAAHFLTVLLSFK